MGDDNKSNNYRLVFITIFLTQFATLVVNVFVNSRTNMFQLQMQKALSNYQKKQQVCSSLEGNKVLLTQFILSLRLVELRKIGLDLVLRSQNPQNPNAIDEMKRLTALADGLAIDVGKSRRELFEQLATVQVLFDRTDRLILLIDNVKKIQILGSELLSKDETFQNLTIDAINQRINQKSREFDEDIQKAFGEPIGELVNYLQIEVRKESP